MSKTLEEILTMYPLQYFSEEERKEIEVLIKVSFQVGKDSIREEILSKLPPKDKARWGSENQTDYIQYEHGFNSCLNQVKDIIKSL